jgi:hypothetical protein
MEHNRKITLELSTVPQRYPGKLQSNWAMKEDGTLFKQHLTLNLWDLKRDETRMYSEYGDIFYTLELYDKIPLKERVSIIAKIFDGEHNRKTNGYQDNASFRILQKDDIINYIEKIAQHSKEPELTK